MVKFTKAIFSIDAGNSEEHVGYHTGELWNGWGNPSFEKDVAEKVVNEFNQVHEEFGEPGDRFEWDGDALIHFQDGEPYRIQPDVIDFEGRKVTVYPIGNNQFCWWIEECEVCEGKGQRSYTPTYINGDLYADGEVLECTDCDGTGYKKPL